MLLLVDWDSVTILQNSKVACNRQFCNKTSKLETKHLKDPGNQKAFKGVPKENKNYTKRSCKKKQNQCSIRNIIRNTEEEI